MRLLYTRDKVKQALHFSIFFFLHQCDACNKKLKMLKEGGKSVSPEEKDRVKFLSHLDEIFPFS